MSETFLIGRLISSDVRQYQFSCSDAVVTLPQIGSMVTADLHLEKTCFGIISDIHWLSDEMVAQLARSDSAVIDNGVLLDNQIQRSGGPMIHVQLVGYYQKNFIQTLPPQPPISLEKIYICGQDDIVHFTGHSFAYLRLLLEAQNVPFCDVIAAHLLSAHSAHLAIGDRQWVRRAMQYLASLLLADYEILAAISEAVSQKISDEYFEEG
jgi:hypothetical protein